jgi:hypothetical protein
MRDFILHDGFLPSCIDLPEETREKIVSQLQVFAKSRRDRDHAVRVEGSRRILSLPVDDTYRIFLRRENGGATLLFVADGSLSIPEISNRERIPGHLVKAPLDALEILLVEGKYLLLAKHLLNVPHATKELQFRVSEIEKIVHAHLPPEARRFHNWWANQRSGKRVHSFAWMAAGWLVSKIDLKVGLVRFVRQNLKVEAAS